MINLLGKAYAAGLLFCIICLDVAVKRRIGVVHAFLKRSAKLCPVTKRKSEVICPSGVTGDDFDCSGPLLQIPSATRGLPKRRLLAVLHF